MSCYRQNLSEDDLANLVNIVQKMGYEMVSSKLSPDHRNAWTSFLINPDLQIFLNFKMSDLDTETNEITVVRYLKEFTVIYHDNETQILNGMKDLSNVRVEGDWVFYNLYAFDSLSGREEEGRSDRLSRRARGGAGRRKNPLEQRMRFENADSLRINLSDYVKNPCLSQYFEDNKMIN